MATLFLAKRITETSRCFARLADEMVSLLIFYTLLHGEMKVDKRVKLRGREETEPLGVRTAPQCGDGKGKKTQCFF